MPSATEVKQAREQSGLSVTRAAKLMNVARITWHRWESEADYHQAMSEAQFELFKHKAGLEKLPFTRLSNYSIKG